MILPVALGFAAGCMVWMVFAELLPDALESAEAAQVRGWASSGRRAGRPGQHHCGLLGAAAERPLHGHFGLLAWRCVARPPCPALALPLAPQVATAATLSAAGLEAFRMLFASMEQPDGTFSGGAPAVAAAAAGRAFVRTFPPLLVLLPAVAAAAASGGALGGAAVPSSVAWGLLAAAAACSGGGSVLDQLLWRPQVPAVHTAAAAAAGACVAVLLHKQLLQWAGTSAAALVAKLLAAKGEANGAASAADVEALEWASLQHGVHHLHHQLRKPHHHHTHPPVPLLHPMHLDPFQQRREKQHHDRQHALEPHPLANGHGASLAALHGAAEEGEAPMSPQPSYMDGPGGALNGWGGSSSALQQVAAPHHRGGAAAAMPGSVTPLSSGACTPVPGENGSHGSSAMLMQWRHSLLLPAPQLAAGATALAALAAGGVAAGWHLACCLLLLSEDRMAVLPPAILLLVAGPGLAGGALARTLPARRGRATGAVVAAALAGLTAVAAAVTAARAHDSPHMAGIVRTYMYPNGITDTAEAMAGGALLAAAAACYGAGAASKPRATRGGALLGFAGVTLLAGLRYFLCSVTPYCLSVQLLLQGR